MRRKSTLEIDRALPALAYDCDAAAVDEAAALAVRTGQIDQALDLYEKLWRFADALPLALRVGQRARAVRAIIV